MTIHRALALFLQGYLNVDWIDEYGDPWGALDDFIASEPIAETLASEIRAILASGQPDDALRTLVIDDLGSGYLPEADGWEYATWLEKVAERADSAIRGRSQ